MTQNYFDFGSAPCNFEYESKQQDDINHVYIMDKCREFRSRQ